MNITRIAKISIAIIAFVLEEIFLRICSGDILYVIGSISAKTGMQFQCKIAVAEATIVHGLTIISSPGCTPIAPTAAIRPEVQS